MLVRSPSAARPWVAPFVVGAAGLAGCVALAVSNPSDSGPPLCPFRTVTGLDCPGCGGLRGVGALGRGDVGGALGHNLLLAVIIPVAVVAYGLWALRSVGVTVRPVRLPPTLVWVAVATVVAFAVLRNLAPFAALGSSAG